MYNKRVIHLSGFILILKNNNNTHTSSTVLEYNYTNKTFNFNYLKRFI